ncbi:hypothetical protein JCM19037_1870 [Geomicrobium sp. JCM 19037]|uniref:hypothetical protein n=1 Tax=Geomicrobium sp. JCM 19037 TaxID=1460634 RepID=UPI00045F49DA|nr:hypothetical protein [Geomicrobium sp. JCM 19037]GAK03535.1 hypothetical protein JCM19037_1870 [Geomicrobium sp. JCM 19037]
MRKSVMIVTLTIVLILLSVLILRESSVTTIGEEINAGELNEIAYIYLQDESGEMKYTYITDESSIRQFSDELFEISIISTNTPIDASNIQYWVEVHSQVEELFTLSLTSNALKISDPNLQNDLTSISTRYYELANVEDIDFINNMELDFRELE